MVGLDSIDFFPARAFEGRVDLILNVNSFGYGEVLRFALVGREVGDDVAQAVRAQRLESFRHQRTAGRAARRDVLLLNLDVAGGVAELHGRAGVAGQDAVVGLAVLRLDRPGDEVFLDD